MSLSPKKGGDALKKAKKPGDTKGEPPPGQKNVIDGKGGEEKKRLIYTRQGRGHNKKRRPPRIEKRGR